MTSWRPRTRSTTRVEPTGTVDLLTMIVPGHEVGADLLGHRLDEGEVGRAVVPLGGGHAEEDELGALHRGGGTDHEPQAPGGLALAHQLLEVVLHDGHPALVQHGHLGRIGVAAGHPVAEMGQRGRGRKAHVADPDDGHRAARGRAAGTRTARPAVAEVRYRTAPRSAARRALAGRAPRRADPPNIHELPCHHRSAPVIVCRPISPASGQASSHLGSFSPVLKRICPGRRPRRPSRTVSAGRRQDARPAGPATPSSAGSMGQPGQPEGGVVEPRVGRPGRRPGRVEVGGGDGLDARPGRDRRRPAWPGRSRTTWSHPGW